MLPGRWRSSVKAPWRDGTTHTVMSPLEFLQRLAALVPRPRLHLIRFHGTLAPNAERRTPNAKLRAMGGASGPRRAHQHVGAGRYGAGLRTPFPVRIRWTRPLKRVFEIDLEPCPKCGGELKLIEVILKSAVNQRILTPLGLSARAPSRVPARQRQPAQAA